MRGNTERAVMLSYFTDLQGSQTSLLFGIQKCWLSYFTDLQGSQTPLIRPSVSAELSYFTDLQGSQTRPKTEQRFMRLSYFTDLQGSQTGVNHYKYNTSLVTLLIYKVLKLLRACSNP